MKVNIWQGIESGTIYHTTPCSKDEKIMEDATNTYIFIGTVELDIKPIYIPPPKKLVERVAQNINLYYRIVDVVPLNACNVRVVYEVEE